ncbi:MAG: TetR/AcrR family transcriptional regulator C-terminal domain-containing protein [Candidatus Gracilibacteria bacterium]|nr:TetR/AcrR family transcriptional regulator C-terminal domain-containing protein [Candidatus Gracilibacteria bacterium]
MKTKSTLSRDTIIQSALVRADKTGIDSLSMRTIARSLGVKAMSLYNHVKNKDDILDGLVEAIVLKIQLPLSEKNWKDALYKRTISAHQVLMQHPWAAFLFVSRANVGPSMLRYVDTTLGYLHQGGFSPELADYAWNTIDSYLYGFIQQTVHFPLKTSEYQKAAEKFLPLLPIDQYPFLHALSLEVISGVHNGIPDFEFGLQLILDSLERTVKRKECETT